MLYPEEILKEKYKILNYILIGIVGILALFKIMMIYIQISIVVSQGHV
jgi:hypothetical protein